MKPHLSRKPANILDVRKNQIVTFCLKEFDCFNLETLTFSSRNLDYKISEFWSFNLKIFIFKLKNLTFSSGDCKMCPIVLFVKAAPVSRRIFLIVK